jgi:hypothetical protein
MFVDSPVLAKALIQQVELNLKRENSWQPVLRDDQILWLTETDGKEETFNHEPQTSWPERVKEGLLILVPGAQYY